MRPFQAIELEVLVEEVAQRIVRARCAEEAARFAGDAVGAGEISALGGVEERVVGRACR